ncbi:twin-arginine translocation pathway signal protein [Halopseudomonas pelagia]|uniref:twin-arginine translocation pathway signal protein n=1 Tax=Halopseudomonas pelagia TaxID=553151 RepID=UPI0030D93203|tara:strand:- start:6384 stop:6917 length:534 start_codon:yes stop_codon:yes gene_type:complete
MSTISAPQLSRRSLLKLGLGASAVLATAGLTATLSGCSSDAPASGFQVLRSSDIPMLTAIMSTLIGPHPALNPANLDGAIAQLDKTLAWTSTAVQKQLTDLFGMLSMGLTRGPLTGIWGSWENATDEDVRAFLERWRDSRLDMLRQGHSALNQLLQMAWYATPVSWEAVGYPGPPTI